MISLVLVIVTLSRFNSHDSMVKLLCDWKPAAQALLPLLAELPRAELLHRDEDGNNVLMLAAYCGHRKLLPAILAAARRCFEAEHSTAFADYVNTANGTKETALTLAIKARGFTDCAELLIAAGATIPAGRSNALTRFCIDKG